MYHQARWTEVEAVIQTERRSGSPTIRRKQLNSVFALGKAMGLLSRIFRG